MLPRRVSGPSGMSEMPVKEYGMSPKPPTGMLPRPEGPKRQGPISVATSQKAGAATASLAQPMEQLRAEANGGSLPAPEMRYEPNAPKKMLGTMSFNNLQPRLPSPESNREAARTMLPRPARIQGFESAPPSVSSGQTMLPRPARLQGGTDQSYAGFTNYLDEKTGGAPVVKRSSTLSVRKNGSFFGSGPMRGKTPGQANLQLREQYSRLSPEEKAVYEAKARMQDISTPVDASAPAVPKAPFVPPVSQEPIGEEAKNLEEWQKEQDELSQQRRLPVKPMLPRR